MFQLAVTLVFAAVVAVTVADVLADRRLGATYVTDVVVWLLSEPVPDILQVTPALVESFATVAVMI